MKKRKDIIAFLGKETEFSGTFKFYGSIRLDGLFKGEIKGDSTLIIGKEGKVEADINVPFVIVLGEVRGNIFADKKVFIHAGGKVYGDIKTPIIAIEDGGFFNGKCLIHDFEGAYEEELPPMSARRINDQAKLDDVELDSDKVIKLPTDDGGFYKDLYGDTK